MTFKSFLWSWLGAFAASFVYGLGMMLLAPGAPFAGLIFASAITGLLFAATWCCLHSLIAPNWALSMLLGIAVALLFAIQFMHFDYTALSFAQVVVWGSMGGGGALLGVRGKRSSKQ